MLAHTLSKRYPMGILAFHLSEMETHYVQAGNYIQTGSPGSAIYHLNKNAGAIFGMCFYGDRCGIIEVKAAQLQTSRIDAKRYWLSRGVKSVYNHLREQYAGAYWPYCGQCY